MTFIEKRIIQIEKELEIQREVLEAANDGNNTNAQIKIAVYITQLTGELEYLKELIGKARGEK